MATRKTPRKAYAAAAAPAASVSKKSGSAADQSFWTRIDRPFVFGFLLTLGALIAIAIGFAVTNLASVLIYIVLALFLALGLNPAVRFLERRGLKRGIAVAVVIVGMLVLVAGMLLLLLPPVIKQIEEFAASIPETVQKFMEGPLYADLVARFGDQVTERITAVQKFLSDPGNIAGIFGGALKFAGAVAGGITGFIMVLILTIYFVVGLPQMENGLLQLAPAYRRPGTKKITDQIIESVGSFVQGQVILSVINALVVLVTFFFAGLPFPLLMAVMAFFLALIPMIGSWIMLALGTGIALLVSPVHALIFFIVYLVYMQIEAYVLAPRILGKAVSVPGSLIVIGALVGGTLLGLLGALIAVPVTAAILIIVNQVVVPKQDAKTQSPDRTIDQAPA